MRICVLDEHHKSLIQKEKRFGRSQICQMIQRNHLTISELKIENLPNEEDEDDILRAICNNDCQLNSLELPRSSSNSSVAAYVEQNAGLQFLKLDNPLKPDEIIQLLNITSNLKHVEFTLSEDSFLVQMPALTLHAAHTNLVRVGAIMFIFKHCK